VVTDVDEKGHAWTVEYNFAEDGKSCTATHVCGNDSKHNETVTATITSKQTQTPSCTVASETTYTATFTETWAETQTKVVTGSTLEHSYIVVYTWTENENGYDYDCVAHRECENCDYVDPTSYTARYVTGSGLADNRVERETTPASCTSDRIDVYTATFTQLWGKDTVIEQKVVTRENTAGHTYEDGECTVCYALLGDISGDGKLTAVDVARLNAHVKGKFTLDAKALLVSDINNDGNITVDDVTLLQSYILGKTSLAR
jgi:hypothetical protein